MGTFASDKHALGECARCGVKMLLKHMLNDGYYPNLIVCPTCWEPRHPQESLLNVEDPTVLYRPAPENLPAPGDFELEAEGGGGGETGVMYVLARTSPNQWQVSDDGISWRTISLVMTANRVYHIRNLQRWFAIGDGIQVSDDGETWTVVSAGGVTWNEMAYAPILGAEHIGRLVVAGNNNLMYSDDGGDTWTVCTLSGIATLTLNVGIAWDQEIERFVANGVANGSAAIYAGSSDGITFVSHGLAVGQDLEFASSNVGRFVANRFMIGGPVVFSTDGMTFSVGSTPPGSGEISIDYGFGLFMVNGTSGGQNVAQRSVDGAAAWTSANVGASGTLGATQEVRPDVTRNQWWYVSANRLHRSDNTLGSAWTQVLTGTNFRAIGVRDLIDP